MGQQEEHPIAVGRGFRYLVEGNYKIVYKTMYPDKIILIVAVFDTRQNPDKLSVE